MPTSPPAILEARRPFGATGLAVSPLGFGGSPIGALGTDEATVGRVLATLLDHGVNLIDTAAMYRASEPMIGRTVGHRRDEFVLVSKCGTPVEEIDAPAWSPSLVTQSIDRSLARLGTDHVDAMLLHSCDAETLRRGEALGALLDARAAGKVRFAGYSGDNDVAALAATLDGIDVIQMSVSVCDQANLAEALPAARAAGCAVMAKRPLANAAWKTLDQQYERYRDYAEPYHERFAAMAPSLDAVRRAAADATLTWPAIALRFTLAIEGVHTAIVGTTDPAHALDGVRAAAAGPLPEPAVALLRDRFAAAEPAGRWEGLR